MKEKLKVLSSITLAVFVLAVFGLVQVNDLSGRWIATSQRGNKSGNFVMTLQVNGSRLTGMLNDASGQTLEIHNGNIAGDQLTFDVAAREHGQSKTIHFFGEKTADAITPRNESKGKQNDYIPSGLRVKSFA